MNRIGFSSGALTRADFRKALAWMADFSSLGALELSALRDTELEPLVAAIPSLDVARFEYTSVHAPSVLRTMTEEAMVSLLSKLPERWSIVVHPEVLLTSELWQTFGARLCIENMDNRKCLGRTKSEMDELFATYPEARFCFDIGHARQIDPTMTTGLLMLRAFGSRLSQVHVSDVGPYGEHQPISVLAKWAFDTIAHRIPTTCPIIIESVIERQAMRREMDVVSAIFDAKVASRATEAYAE